jgi:cold shock CspA family protein
MELTMLGTVTFYHPKRGYGFITVTNGTEYFFHVSNFTPGSTPVVGAIVHFILGQPVRGGSRLQGLNVRYAFVEEINKAQLAGVNALARGSNQ